MHDILKTQGQLQAKILFFDFPGGIPSSQAAASIKFGLEALLGVDRVGFVGDSIEVTIDSEGTRLECLWEALATAGFAADEIHLRDGADLQTPSNRQSPVESTLE